MEGARSRLVGVAEEQHPYRLPLLYSREQLRCKGRRRQMRQVAKVKVRKIAEAPAQIAPEDLADLAQRLNQTLWEHLPRHKKHWFLSRQSVEASGKALGDQTLDIAYCPVPLPEERALAVLGAKNCIRRINFDNPDDVITEEELAQVATDLLEAIDRVSTNKASCLAALRDYQERRFLIPRYRVLYCGRSLPCPRSEKKNCRKQCQERITLSLGTAPPLVYHDDLLEKIQIGSEKEGAPLIPGDLSPVRYYRRQGLLIENPQALKPGSKKFRSSTPLFTFSQVWQVLKISRVLRLPSVSPIVPLWEYEKIREKYLPFIQQTLKEIGYPQFCKNPKCVRPLSPSDINRERLTEFSPTGGQVPLTNQQAKRWPREYCSNRCRQSDKNGNKPKSTPRVQKYFAKGLEPFQSFNEPHLPLVIEE
jgi:hypothetical protein